jgi:hypothetical protein
VFGHDQLVRVFRLLAGRLALDEAPAYRLVVCGGTSLIAMGLVARATRDVDILALSGENGELVDPAPLPVPLVRAAAEVADDLDLPADWLNNGPSSGEGGLFQLGLPAGLTERLTWRAFGEKLSVGFISRLDQIHFKLYAAVDRAGGYHAADLEALEPGDDELLAAMAWTRTHDPSEGYLLGLRWLLKELGHAHLAECL